jgi:hypothetical protein
MYMFTKVPRENHRPNANPSVCAEIKLNFHGDKYGDHE